MSESEASTRLADRVGEELARAAATPRYTAWEVVRTCGREIAAAKQRGVSWEAIAATLREVAQEVYGVSVALSPRTAADYYSRLTHRKGRSDRRRPATQRRSRSERRAAAAPAVSGREPSRPSPSAETPAPGAAATDAYQRPEGSRFTPGYRVKYWTGGQPDE